MTRISTTIALSIALPVIAGCGDGGPEMIPIRGEVFYNGAPLSDGMVVYLPAAAGDMQQASGRIQEDGKFELTTSKRGDGVRVGEYHIIVQAYSRPGSRLLTREETESGVRISEPKLIIPEKYVDPSRSGLSDTVNSEHSGFKRIELKD